ncbi:MAG: protein-glutamate O-methyltransferase CheR [gamma proteobacterium symbiont of Taylorina sp.]|nr:protein-glutamate O-methyltransferase CheR [gamma proteobacterium symbiont of Taylorina sp.]
MTLNKIEFKSFQKLILDAVGMSLDDSKLDLVQNRLYSRLLHYEIDSFSHYLKIVNQDPEEKIQMINHLTTNETSFFRESQHFDFLTSIVRQISVNPAAADSERQQPLRIWSAASSVGAEAYSIAMILDNFLNLKQWQIIGTDINTEVIKKAKKGLYCESWTNKIPAYYKKKYCLKGSGRFAGKFLIDQKLSTNMKFDINNLIVPDSCYGSFDIIFLRNVFIYFNTKTKQQVLNNILANLNIGGYLIISLTENLDGLDTGYLKKCQTSIYQKKGIGQE